MGTQGTSTPPRASPFSPTVLPGFTPRPDAPPIPRIRPGFVLALLLLTGVVLLRHGALQRWFTGWPGAESLPELSHSLWWAGLGMGYGLVCIAIWILLGLGRRLHGRWVWLGSLVALVLMLGGSQVAADHARGPQAPTEAKLYLIVKGVRWDPKGQEFVVGLLAPPAVAGGFRRGSYEAEAEIFGKGGRRPRGVFAPGRTPIYPMYVDEETLLDAPQRDPGRVVQPGESFPVRGRGGYLVDVGEIRVPWNRKESAKALHWLEVFSDDSAVLYQMLSVTAVLLSRNGERVGLATRTDFKMAWEIIIR